MGGTLRSGKGHVIFFNLHQMGTCKEIEDLTQFKNLSKCGGGDDEVSLELLTVLIAKDFIPLDHIFK